MIKGSIQQEDVTIIYPTSGHLNILNNLTDLKGQINNNTII